MVPLVIPDLSSHALFLIACVVTAVTLFLMGAVKVGPSAGQLWGFRA